MDVFQILLSAKNCSGRGVRYKLLTPTEKDKVQSAVAKLVGPETTILELRNLENKYGVQSMITEITKSDGFASEDQLPGADWMKCPPGSLADTYDSYFTSKDDAILCRVYQKNHEVSESEVDAIMGKAIHVAV